MSRQDDDPTCYWDRDTQRWEPSPRHCTHEEWGAGMEALAEGREAWRCYKCPEEVPEPVARAIWDSDPEHIDLHEACRRAVAARKN